MCVSVKILTHVFPLIPPVWAEVSAIILANPATEAAAFILAFHFLKERMLIAYNFLFLQNHTSYTHV